MAARKPTGYKVIGAAAVIRNGKSERYLYRGDEVTADEIDDDNAKHLLGIKLIKPLFAAERQSAQQSAKADADAKDKADADGADTKAADDAAKSTTPQAS